MLPRLVFFALISIAMVFIAKRKGFNPLCWVIAGSIVGFVVLLVLPAATENGIDEAERLKREKSANRIGIFLSIIVLIFASMVIGLILFPGYL